MDNYEIHKIKIRANWYAKRFYTELSEEDLREKMLLLQDAVDMLFEKEFYKPLKLILAMLPRVSVKWLLYGSGRECGNPYSPLNSEPAEININVD